MQTREPILALDTASPTVSLAVARGEEVLGERVLELRRSSELLLAAADELLSGAGLVPANLGGVVATAGPGSFTGLRVGLATALGLHQALGCPATTLPTLAVLAGAARRPGETLTAAVDALRGQWYAARYRAEPWPVPVGPEGLLDAAELLAGEGPVIGFGLQDLAQDGLPTAELLEPPPLAAVAARLAARPEATWDPSRLVRPVYFRPPAVTPS